MNQEDYVPSVLPRCAVCGHVADVVELNTPKTKNWIGRESHKWPDVPPGSYICDACVLAKYPEAIKNP